MKPKVIKVLEMCIEIGTSVGLNRAYKHDSNPSRDTVESSIAMEIMNQIYEWFDMELDDEG